MRPDSDHRKFRGRKRNRADRTEQMTRVNKKMKGIGNEFS